MNCTHGYWEYFIFPIAVIFRQALHFRENIFIEINQSSFAKTVWQRKGPEVYRAILRYSIKFLFPRIDMPVYVIKSIVAY